MILTLNQLPTYRSPLLPDDAACVDERAAGEVENMLRLCPAHRPTPLFCLDQLARRLGVQRIYVKDESQRLGLGSFKALGGAFAVIRVVLDQAQRLLGRTVAPAELMSDEVRMAARTLTVCCATDGNHGRSVAAGARMLGVRAVIYVHEFVSARRVAAISALGAEVRQVAGNYDESVALAARESAANGWIVVSDTSWHGYEEIPRIVTQGYTAMVREVCHALDAPPTHVFVQAGVGGLAAAVAGHLSMVYGEARPRVVVVEPERAACLYASHQAGRRVAIAAREPTIMAMLECYEPSLIAWRIISRVADAFMQVTEEDAILAMRQLAAPIGGDRPIVSGESGAAGMAGLLRVMEERLAEQPLGLNGDSRVLLFSTEGATDPASYLQHVGRTSEEVLEAGAAAVPLRGFGGVIE
jgi:diaminopropionate ammonia-lyase